MAALGPHSEVAVEGDGAICEIKSCCTGYICMMLKEVLGAVLKSGFLLDDPIHQIWRAETRGWNKGKSMSSSLHFKFLYSEQQVPVGVLQFFFVGFQVPLHVAVHAVTFGYSPRMLLRWFPCSSACLDHLTSESKYLVL